MKTKTDKETVLALYPNRYGVAYALFDAPDDLVEYGVGYIQPVNNQKTLNRIKDYISYYKPDIVLTRNINDLNPSRKSKRIEKLISLICDEVKNQGLEVHTYTRTQIKNMFEQFEAYSKYQISKKIIGWYKQLEAYEFPERERWMGENANVGVFDAVSLVLVHWFLE